MNRVIFFDSNGDPTSTALYSRPEDAANSGGYELGDDISDDYAISRLYLSGGEIKVREEKPSDYHYWSAESEQWLEDLAGLRNDLIQRVEHRAEITRQRFITPGAGQAMTYQAKYDEARKLDDPTPMIDSEAEARGMSREELAQEIIERYVAWKQVGSRIEVERQTTKANLRKAEDAARMNTLFQAYVSALDAL